MKSRQKIQTKRNPTNAKKIGRAQEHWKRVLNKLYYYKWKGRGE